MNDRTLGLIVLGVIGSISVAGCILLGLNNQDYTAFVAIASACVGAVGGVLAPRSGA